MFSGDVLPWFGVETVRELVVVSIGVAFAKLIEYLAVKVYTKIDSMIHSPLDINHDIVD